MSNTVGSPTSVTNAQATTAPAQTQRAAAGGNKTSGHHGHKRASSTQAAPSNPQTTASPATQAAIILGNPSGSK